MQLVTQGYKAGEAGYLDVLTAQRTLFQTNLQYLDALETFWDAGQQIEGLLLDGSLRE